MLPDKDFHTTQQLGDSYNVEGLKERVVSTPVSDENGKVSGPLEVFDSSEWDRLCEQGFSVRIET